MAMYRPDCDLLIEKTPKKSGYGWLANEENQEMSYVGK